MSRKIILILLFAISVMSAHLVQAATVCNPCKSKPGCELVVNTNCINDCDLGTLLYGTPSYPWWQLNERISNNRDIAKAKCRNEMIAKINGLLNEYKRYIGQADKEALNSLKQQIDSGDIGVSTTQEIEDLNATIQLYADNFYSIYNTMGDYEDVDVWNLDQMKALLPDYEGGGTYDDSQWKCVNGAWSTNPYKAHCNATFDIAGNNGEACPSSQHYSNAQCTASQDLDSTIKVTIPRLKRRKPDSAHCYTNPETGKCIDTIFDSCKEARCYRCTNFKSCASAANKGMIYDPTCSKHGNIYDPSDSSCNAQANDNIRQNCYDYDRLNNTYIDVGRVARKNTVTNDIGKSMKCITRCSQTCEEISREQAQYAAAGLYLYNTVQYSCQSQHRNPIIHRPTDKYGLRPTCLSGCVDPCTQKNSSWHMETTCQDNEINNTTTVTNYYGEQVTCYTGCRDACRLVDSALTAYAPACQAGMTPAYQTVYSSDLHRNITCYHGCEYACHNDSQCRNTSDSVHTYTTYTIPQLARNYNRANQPPENIITYLDLAASVNKNIHYAGGSMVTTTNKLWCDTQVCPLTDCKPQEPSGYQQNKNRQCGSNQVASYAFAHDSCGNLYRWIKDCQNKRPDPTPQDECKDDFGHQYTIYNYGKTYSLIQRQDGKYECQETGCVKNPTDLVCVREEDAGFGTYRSICSDESDCGEMHYHVHACRQPTCNSNYKLGTGVNIVEYNKCGSPSPQSETYGLGGVYQCDIQTSIIDHDDSFDVVSQTVPCTDGGLKCYRLLTCQQSDSLHPDAYNPSKTNESELFIPEIEYQRAHTNGYRCGRYISVSNPGYLIGGVGAVTSNSVTNHSNYATRCGVSVTPQVVTNLSDTDTISYDYFRQRVNIDRLEECTDLDPSSFAHTAQVICQMPSGSKSSQLDEQWLHADRNLIIFVENGDFTIDTSIATDQDYFKAFIINGKLTVAANIGTNPWDRVDSSGQGICPDPYEAEIQAFLGANSFDLGTREYTDARLEPYAINQPLYCDRQLTIAGSLVMWGAGNLELKRTFRGCVNASGYNSGNWHQDLRTAWSEVIENPSLYPNYNAIITPFVFMERPDFIQSAPTWMKGNNVERVETN